MKNDQMPNTQYLLGIFAFLYKFLYELCHLWTFLIFTFICNFLCYFFLKKKWMLNIWDQRIMVMMTYVSLIVLLRILYSYLEIRETNNINGSAKLIENLEEPLLYFFAKKKRLLPINKSKSYIH